MVFDPILITWNYPDRMGNLMRFHKKLMKQVALVISGRTDVRIRMIVDCSHPTDGEQKRIRAIILMRLFIASILMREKRQLISRNFAGP